LVIDHEIFSFVLLYSTLLLLMMQHLCTMKIIISIVYVAF